MFTKVQLPYATDALQPYLDQLTVETHYGKHHQTYLNKLNEMVEDLPVLSKFTSVVEVLTNLNEIPEDKRQAVLNNAGQVYNHDLYWESMAPNAGGLPNRLLAEKIEAEFGSFAQFKELFVAAGTTQFGSGWAWLSVDAGGKLEVTKTSNADSPLIHGLKPILTMDVWEHAYYLKYKNLRPDYIQAFFELINWTEVERKYNLAVS